MAATRGCQYAWFWNKHQISDKYNNIFYLYITKYKNSCFKKKGWAFGRKSSPSFCQDTPDKESRRHWEVVMIVLTSGKDASIAYCLTTALYCPLPEQYLAIARHKTIRRERKKSPLSFLLFTLHQIVWNPDKHWGSERWRVGSTLHHPSPTLHLDILFSVRRLSSARRPSGFAISCKKMFDLWNWGICNPPSIYKQLAKKSGVKSGEEPSVLFTLPNQLIHKYLRHSGEGWRVFLKVADNRYKLQRITNPQRKGRTFFNSGLQIRWDA